MNAHDRELLLSAQRKMSASNAAAMSAEERDVFLLYGTEQDAALLRKAFEPQTPEPTPSPTPQARSLTLKRAFHIYGEKVLKPAFGVVKERIAALEARGQQTDAANAALEQRNAELERRVLELEADRAAKEVPDGA